MLKIILIIFIGFALSSCGESSVFSGSEMTPVSSPAEFSSESESEELSSSSSQKTSFDPMFDTEEYLPAYDYDNHFLPLLRNAAVNDSTVYYLKSCGAESYLYYYDRKTQISDVLCGNPDCLHHDKTCKGYVGLCSPGLFLYDGKLYWISAILDPDGNSTTDYALHRCNEDGSSREQVIRIDTEMRYQYQPCEYYLHRGYLYFVGEEGTVDEEGNVSQLITIKAISLKDENEINTIHEKKYRGVCRPKLYFSGNRIIYYYGFREGEKIYGSICSYNIRTGETEEVWGGYIEDEMGMRLAEQSFWIKDDTIYAVFCHYKSDSSETVLKKLENGRWEEVYVPSEETLLMLDGGGLLVDYKDEGEDPLNPEGITIYVRDLEGNLLYKGKLPEIEDRTGILCLGGSYEEIYISYMAKSIGWAYLIRADIRNQTPPEIIIE